MSNQKLEELTELFEEADILFMISGGAYVSVYDTCCEQIIKQLSKDLSIEQIQSIIWNAFFDEFCKCEVAASKAKFVLDKNAATAILGTPERYRDIAFNIRHTIIGL